MLQYQQKRSQHFVTDVMRDVTSGKGLTPGSKFFAVRICTPKSKKTFKNLKNPKT